MEAGQHRVEVDDGGLLATEHVDQVAARFTESEEFHLAGGVDHHQLTRQRVELLGYVTGLSGEEVSGEDLCTVGAEVVLVHDLGEGNHVTHINSAS